MKGVTDMNITTGAIVYGDDISTDLIIAGKYTKTLDPNDLVVHCMEDLDSDFRSKCKDGAAIVAGKYFGCGSSREQAPVALLGSGIRFVAAKSFSRIFYRSAINLGLPLLECDTDAIRDGDKLSYELGGDVLCNLTQGTSYPIKPLPTLMVRILQNGGMVEVMKKYGNMDTFLKKVQN